MQSPLLRAAFAAGTILGFAFPVHADIRRLVVEHTETLGADGYQKLTGRAYGELDPRLPLNAIITDLQFAPRNARGMVEYVATFTILKPADISKASGVLLYFVPNRGRVNLTDGGFFIDARKKGHVLVASGWQGDLEPAAGMETLSVPVARNPDGSSITGRVVALFSDMPANATTLPVLRGGVAGTADPASLDTSRATLSRRAAEGGAAVPLRSEDWAFADCTTTPFPGTPDPRKINHFGLHVDDVKAAAALLRQRGVKIDDPRVGRTISFITSATGPAGVRMELSEIGPESMLGKAIAGWR